jgi:3-oxoacyl-[acyl-carrier protein] reductase
VDIRGKVALVTGAASWQGAGRAAAVALAARGAAAVAVNYRRSADAADDVAAELRRLGAQAWPVQADVAADDAVRRMVDGVVERFGRLDILINNAAYTRRVRFDDLEGLTDEVWDRTLAVNLKGAFYCVRAAAESLRRSGSGVVVNTSSIAGVRAVGSSSVAYAASKAALINMTQTLARALAPEVRVNAVAPGFVEGQWMRSQETGIGDRYERTRERTAARVPLRRVATPEDVAQVVMALVESDFVTGQTWVVDGGYLAVD